MVLTFYFEGLATNNPKKHPSKINGAHAQVLEDRSCCETRLYNHHRVTEGDFEGGMEKVHYLLL